ncbi:MAG: Na+/Ca+ antiporter, CaCA family [Candidatus Magasanikbacteria bacterium GW2011_GWC2_34_16]|uniref:Na+/Ca+ antiporter, CaCA family n=2 Tax=Candidatus Magasanikiibacteriota TaxID=1752731 RepID=A0A0G0JR24_9BACT|nr:MAG: Na+/Ca+ antiporter, CaCA family [Candidatus Magasanikbacteria bacterium GW2011_GWC2_34_16]KKQ39359.1 MAG: Na+/Ca+ antiporter, CaCA family [Candidatus Magasanikbacteria bacterium GW2011_GWA2_37_8]
MFVAIFLVIISLAVLIAGAETLVRGSASIAKKAGISPLVIGLTVVAFGTSAPELVVNLISAFKGSADIAIGNVVGSNIANILLILGVATIVYPLSVKKSTVWKEIPFALLAVLLIFTMGNDAFFDGSSFNAITRTDGFSLIAIFAIFMFYAFGIAKTEGSAEDVKTYSWRLSSFLTISGLILLFIGGKVLVDNAVILARLAGLSESLIGLTIVAIGTSLPELATSIVAAYHHQNDIAIGNIIGSNIFNVFWILGVTSTILQIPFSPSINIDILVSIFATLLLLVFIFVGSRHKLNRWQGVIFILLYISYIAYLIHRG